MTTAGLLKFATVVAGYFAAGKFGLALALVHASASAVWPPTGIAIASLLGWGMRLWPAIFIGAFIVNVTTSGDVPSSIGIAIGNTLEAVVATLLVNRFAGGWQAFDRARDLFRYVCLAALLSTAISATIGVLVLAAGDGSVWPRLGAIWLTWWIGDAIGAAIVAPAIVLWAKPPLNRRHTGKQVEAAAVAAAVLIASLAVFAGWWSWPAALPLEFVCVPPILWAAFTFGARGAVTATIATSAIALWGTQQGLGPFAPHALEALPLLQTFIGVVGVTALAVGSLNSERQVAEQQSRELQDALAERIRERTADLQESNRLLAAEITDRDRAAVALERSEARLLEAQHVARIGSWEWNIGSDEVWWSAELFRIYGLDAATFAASYTGFMERVHPDDRRVVEHHVRNALETAGSMSFEHRVVRPDGAVRWLMARGRVITDSSSRPVRMLGTGQDITEWKALQAQRAALAGEQLARHQAEEANRHKDEFLAVLSHELRTPLNAIMGWLQLLALRPLDAETRRAVDVIDRNSQTLRRIIEDLLDLSAITSGKLRLSLQPMDVQPTLQLVLDSVRPRATPQEITLELRAGEPLYVAGDSQRLQQAVANLVTNAVKFTSTGGRVIVSAAREDDQVVITVADSGVGIAPEVLPYVFDAFRQGDVTFARGQGGLGLGLAITRHLVELHRGTVHVESPGEHRGATFIVRLPAVAAPEQTTSATPAASAAALSGVRLLVVDDDPDARSIFELGLTSAGAEVTSAASALEAEHCLRQGSPDALLVDIQMPGKDGYTFVRELRARGDRRPMVAVTAHASDDDRRRAMDAGFDRHLTKPVQLPELVTTLSDLLTGRVAAAAGASPGNQRRPNDSPA